MSIEFLSLLLWGLVLVMNLFSFFDNESPTWANVFCPLGALLIIIATDFIKTLV